MRKLSLFVAFVGFFLFAGCASATTYFISYSSGANSNSGTSKTTPWKTHPYMQTRSSCTGTGSAPTYSHSSGDQFIFKQGDSWPNACFDMQVQGGGASGNPDVYTFDPTWGTSGGTTGNKGQKVGTYQFSAGGTVISGASGINRFIDVSCCSNVTFNGMEFSGMTWSGSPAYGQVLMVDVESSTFIVVSNIWAHNWTHPGANTNGGDALTVMQGRGLTADTGDTLSSSVVDGANSGGSGVADSGAATFQIPNGDNNIIRNVSNGLLLGQNGTAHDNNIGPVNKSFDATTHENCIEPIGLSNVNNIYIYNNVLHDCYAVNILTQGTGGSGNETDYIWNNVFYVGSVTTIPLQFDTADSPNSGSSVYAWNNTIYVGPNYPCMRIVGRGTGNFAVFNVQNNLCISDYGVIDMAGVSGGSTTNAHNLLLSSSTAASQGYSSSETYAYSPTASSNATVGAGANLAGLAGAATATLNSDTTFGGVKSPSSRPTSGAWDIGAYQFGSSGGPSPTPAPPTNVKVLTVQ